MKIAVFGWYGHNNAGDERIKYCLNKFLINMGGINVVDFYDLHEHAIKGKSSEFDRYDLLIIGGGGLILSQCNYHDFINGIKTKIVTLGVSIERENLIGNAKKFAISLLEKSLGFLVRDESSKKKLLKYDVNKKIRVSPDLTFLEPYETANLVDSNIIGINLLPKPAYFEYSILSMPVFNFILRQLHKYGFESLIKAENFQDVIASCKIAKYEFLPIPLYCALPSDIESFYQQSDVTFLKNIFLNVPNQFNDKDIDKCKIFISMRLHGAIFATQKGIPVISLYYLPKNRNFMHSIGLEDLVIMRFDKQQILTAIDYVNNNRDIIQKKMLTYKQQACFKIRQDVLELFNSIN